MTQRTRYFLIGSALVLVGGLCTGLVAYYGGGLPMLRDSAPGPVELAYLPEDVTAVGYADVRQIMASDFRQRIRQVLPTGEEQAKIQAELGIDIERDIDTVVAALVGRATGDPGAVVLVRGRFNEGQIEAHALQHGARLEQYQGIRMLLVPEGHGADPQDATGGADAVARKLETTGGVAFLEAGLVALGDAATIKRAVDAHASGANVLKNADLIAHIAEVERRGNAWAVGRFDAVAGTASLPQQLQDQIPPVQWLSVSASINGGVSGMLRAEARDDQAAENLRDIVRGGLAAARLMAGRDTRLDTLVNSLQVTGTGNTVELSFAVPPEVIDILNGIAGAANLVGANPLR